MTETMNPSEEEKTYTSDQQGLREAANEIGSNQGELVEVKLDDDEPKQLSIKEATKKLQDHHAQQAQDQEVIRKAMGLDLPEISKEEQVEARISELEQSRSAPDVDYHYQEGQQQLRVAQQQAHQVQLYAESLARDFADKFPEMP